jgi:iron complex transport system substrate-binding protein
LLETLLRDGWDSEHPYARLLLRHGLHQTCDAGFVVPQRRSSCAKRDRIHKTKLRNKKQAFGVVFDMAIAFGRSALSAQRLTRNAKLFGIALALLAVLSGASAQGVAADEAAPLASPHRVVSLDLCTDEMLAYYSARAPGLKSEVTALSPLSRQSSVGQGSGMDLTGWPVHDGSLEQVLALHPDLALTGPYNAPLLRQRLTQLGVRVEVLPLPQRLADIGSYERRLLELLRLPASLADAPALPVAPALDHAPRLLLLGANGIGTGTGTLEGDILARAGWRNYVQAPGYVPLDLERIAVDPPDAVLWAAPASPALANRFAQHPALRRAVPADRWLVSDVWRWHCPGPWSWDLVRQLNRLRH